jgi:FtsH-binding integral membrane protein
MLAPPLVCGAWVFYAERALDGNPQWFMVPIGVTLLVVAGLMRQLLRSRHEDPASAGVVLMELAGIVAMVGTSFVQAFTVSLDYAGLAAMIGVFVAGWGLLTQVRRRLIAGVVIVLLAAVVLVGVPLAQLIPGWTGAALWVAIAVIGLLAIVGATLLEQGRAVVHRGLQNVREMTEDWE